MQLRRFLLVLMMGLPVVFAGRMARCADRDFFGAIADLDDEAVADKLGLSKETRANISSLIEKRLNDPSFVDLAVSAKNLPAEEKTAKLKSFREESEKLGLKLLTDEQQKKLQQVRLEKAGLLALADPEIAKQLGLNDDQKAQVAELVSNQQKQLNVASAVQKNTLISYFATKLAQVLTDEQRTKWEAMGGQVPSTESSKSAEAPADSQEAQAVHRRGAAILAAPITAAADLTAELSAVVSAVAAATAAVGIRPNLRSLAKVTPRKWNSISRIHPGQMSSSSLRSGPVIRW